MSNKEIPWINWAKSVCIFLVYLYHTSVYSGYDERLLYPAYAPFFTNAFFFISGYLLFNKQLQISIISIPTKKWIDGGEGKKYVTNVLYKLIIPTIIFATCNYFPKVLLRGQGIDGWTFIRDTILGGSMWFTCSLAISELLLFIMLLTRKQNILFYAICSVFVASISYLMSQKEVYFMNEPNIPWFFKTGMFATLYLAVGGIYWKIEERMNHKIGELSWLLLTLIYVVLLFLVKNDAMIYLNILKVNSLGIALSFVGILALISVCKKFPNNIVINWMGRHTLGLYFLSGGIPNVLSVVWLHFMGVYTVLSYIIVSLSSFLIGVVCVCLIDKYIPIVFDLRRFLHNK